MAATAQQSLKCPCGAEAAMSFSCGERVTHYCELHAPVPKELHAPVPKECT